MTKRILILLFAVATCGAVWAAVHFKNSRWHNAHQIANASSNFTNSTSAYSWAEAIEKVKADRGQAEGGNGSIETPPELRHYSDRHWFLAAQVAEVEKYKIDICQDFVDLAGMIERGEMVSLPAVTNTYVLYGVGAKADEDVFSKYQDDKSIKLYNEAQLTDVYQQLNQKRSELEKQIGDLKRQSGTLKRGDRAKQKELQKQIAGYEQNLKSVDEDKALLDQFYGQPSSREKLFRDYESLQKLAKNFAGRSYNLDNPSDRKQLKVNMLSSVRPVTLKVLEEVASAYHNQFDRPLPVSSLVRPEQYQHALRKVNRNAVLIDTPPHSTGLAFDIDYRYMGAAEQNFLMAELARLKNAGRIEVIRERNANYHVFAFLNGTRPSDDLITASLDEAQAPLQESHHAVAKTSKAKSGSKKARSRSSKSRVSKSSGRKTRRH